MQKEQEKELTVKESVMSEPTELSKLVMRWFNGILYRFSGAARAPADLCEVIRQIVVPEVYHSRLLWLAHEDHLAGHFGVNKTLRRLAEHFYWPKMKDEVKRYISSCNICQVVGKPNQKIPKAP